MKKCDAGASYNSRKPEHMKLLVHDWKLSSRWKGSASPLYASSLYAAAAWNFMPSAFATFRTVAKLGFPSALSAR